MCLRSMSRTTGDLARSTGRRFSLFTACASAVSPSRDSTMPGVLRAVHCAASVSTELPSQSAAFREAFRSSSSATTWLWPARTASASGVRASLSTSSKAFCTLKSSFLGIFFSSASACRNNCKSGVSADSFGSISAFTSGSFSGSFSTFFGPFSSTSAFSALDFVFALSAFSSLGIFILITLTSASWALLGSASEASSFFASTTARLCLWLFRGLRLSPFSSAAVLPPPASPLSALSAFSAFSTLAAAKMLSSSACRP
mmetsp:Transcript_78357/g.187872  ORF Transcript_78357/g.187872 Transcript_78357/m.187872 type:complete len:258 (-) Transcript_78357:436-1209(-)